MGALLQVYRDWKLSGDDTWLKSLWPRMKKALAYTWDPTNEYQWDRDRDGILEGRQHHTAIDIISGALQIKELRLPYLTSVISVQADGKTLTDAVLQNGCITFAPQTIVHSIVVY